MSLVDRWKEGGLVEVTLPSGLRIRGRMPSTQDLILANLAPRDLLAAVEQLGERQPSTFDDGERATWVRWQRVQAAAFVRHAWDPDAVAWEPVVITADMLGDGIPPDDVDALEDLVLRRRTPLQVTARSRFTRDEIDLGELQRILAEEAAGTVDAWSSFRVEPERATPGDDGGDVPPGPEPLAAGARPGRPPRGRPGAGAAAAG